MGADHPGTFLTNAPDAIQYIIHGPLFPIQAGKHGRAQFPAAEEIGILITFPASGPHKIHKTGQGSHGIRLPAKRFP